MLDIAWAEGVLTDGHPYRAESWMENGVFDFTKSLVVCEKPLRPALELNRW